ncbi:MAG: hypothetical protein MI923_01980 [Phycisphaerales bacterium]|nr:hypothetical protein [Phycisphaerales bacterium]
MGRARRSSRGTVFAPRISVPHCPRATVAVTRTRVACSKSTTPIASSRWIVTLHTRRHVHQLCRTGPRHDPQIDIVYHELRLFDKQQVAI